MRLVSKFYDSNVFLIEKNEEVVIVDAGVELEKVKEAVCGRKVSGILLTHGHFDHTYFVLKYQKEFGCKVFASEKIREYLEDEKKNYSTDFKNTFLKVKNFDNFVFLKGGGEVHIGSFEISHLQLGGHSKSDMCYIFGDEIFVGDIVLGRAIGRTDLYGGDKFEMLKSLETLKKLDYKVMHCGHGEDFDKNTQDKVCSIYIKFLSR